MTSVKLCECGCGEPAVYAARHSPRTLRARLTEDDYRLEERGYETPCFIFKNNVRPRATGGGYNMVRVAGKQVYAHRAMYIQEVGPIPNGFHLDHLCRQPSCIRPDHLEAVTPAENRRRGANIKLSMEAARAIRDLEGSVSAPKLAADFDVSEFLIYQIWSEKIWREQ